MTFYKKFFAVVLSLAMLVSCFAVSASAYVYSPSVTGGELKLSISADKTTVNPGDVVSFEMKIDRGSYTDLSAFAHLFLYNGNQLSPVGTTVQNWRQFQNEVATIVSTSAGGNMNFATSNAKLKAQLTEEEQAYYTKGIMVAGQLGSAAYRWNPAKDEVYMTFKMTVADTVTPGEEIWFGLHDAGYKALLSTFAINGVVQKDMSVFNLKDSMIKLTVATPAPAGPTINQLGSQIRFNGLESAPGAHDADFDIRTRASISKADMMTLLGTDEAGLTAALKTANIRMGFVYQATVNGPFIEDDAKAAAIAGKDQGTYKVKDVKYAAFEGDDILWTCFIDDAKYDGKVIALPYIILNGTPYFLDGTITCTFSDGYNAKYDKYAQSQATQS